MEFKVGVLIASYTTGLLLGSLAWWHMKKTVLAGLRFWLAPSAEAAEVAALSRELTALKLEAERLMAGGGAVEAAEGGAFISSQHDQPLLLPVGGGEEGPRFTLSSAATPLWDRLEFLEQCGVCVIQMSRLLDEHLCDNFEGVNAGRRLAQALRSLLLGAAAWAQAEAAAASDSASLAALQANGELWGSQAGERVVRPWLAALVRGSGPLLPAAGAAALSKPQALAALERLVALHAQLTLWPAASDASIRWAHAEAGDAPPRVDFAKGGAELYLPFSPAGRPVRAGMTVLVAGPALLSRQPRDGEPLGEVQLADLRGLRCLTLVIDEGGD